MQRFKDFVYNYNRLVPAGDIVNAYLRGEKIQEISKSTNISIGSIYRILSNNHVIPNRIHSRKNMVLHYYEYGMPIDQIASFTNYSKGHVRRIIKNNANRS